MVSEDGALDALLAGRAVTPVFQPIVDVASGEVVGMEALARGSEGGVLARPDAMFAAARRVGRLAELDALCRARALEEAAAAGLSGPIGLFLNTEPLSAPREFRSSAAIIELADRGVRLVFELTERDLTADPARLLAFADCARSLGYRIALDDVGADPASLALMPFLRPEVVKLDLSLVHGRPAPAVAEVMSAVAAYAEQSDAVVLAEGVETSEHLATARGLGATLVQGWYFGPGQPAQMLADLPAPRRPPPLRPPDVDRAARGPFVAATRWRAPRRASKALLLAVTHHLENQAADQGELAVVLAAYEDAGNFTPASRSRYRTLAESAAFVGVLGTGIGPEPEPGIRGADLAADDPVREEWDVLVVGPHFAAALIARDLDPLGDHADLSREFDYVLTHDRALVLELARSLMARLLPASPPSGVLSSFSAPERVAIPVTMSPDRGV